jgi:hypothetical protein
VLGTRLGDDRPPDGESPVLLPPFPTEPPNGAPLPFPLLGLLVLGTRLGDDRPPDGVSPVLLPPLPSETLMLDG